MPQIEVDTLARLDIGNGGWCRYLNPDLKDGYVLIRFAERDGRLEPVELYIGPSTPVLHAVAKLRISRAVRCANQPSTAQEIRQRIRWAESSRVAPTVTVEVRKPFHQPPPPFTKAVALAPDAKLPKKDKVPRDEFYREVGRVYAEVSRIVPNPAVYIAKANDEDRVRVYEWIKQARNRGYLPHTGRGRTF